MDPFAKHTPSVFVVYTPFQVLCAIASIRQLEIEDYKVITRFPGGEVRNSQTKALLEKYHIIYQEAHWFKFVRVNLWVYIAWSLIWRKNRYKRLFLGDLRDVVTYFMGFVYASNRSSVVFLDDGNITINYLQDSISEPIKKIYKLLISFISRWRGMDVGHNYLTIYGDINSPKNRVCQLDLHHVVNDSPASLVQPKDVYIVGTNVERFCEPLEIPKDYYIQKLGELMCQLKQKYPEDNILFIPHGREVLDYGQRLCKQYGCIFQRPKMMIELELLNMENSPKAIYGYTSTALHTLKKIFPSAKVVNILFESPLDNPFYKDYLMCSEYYANNGIELIKESL